MSLNVTIYTTGPRCQKCNLTKQQFDKAGVAYTEVRLDENPELAAEWREKGHAIAPVVDVSTPGGARVDLWSDFRRDRIKAVIAKAAA